ncbi:glycolipid transfer protein [Martensiomyces pterosporus]|nr:glycolipid transfer protein [Martensiomyces pterosporus]
MATFVERVPRRFNDVAVTEAGINTKEFLEAASGVVMLFDELGSAAFGPVKSDINGNITKVRAKLESGPAEFDTLEKIVLAEAGTKDRTATQGLLWLKRGLEFTALGVSRNLANANEELTVSFTEAYGKTLKQYHNFVVKGVFNLAMKACPYRKDFYEKLGGDNEQVYADLKVWTDSLQQQLNQLSVFYAKGAYDKGL